MPVCGAPLQPSSNGDRPLTRFGGSRILAGAVDAVTENVITARRTRVKRRIAPEPLRTDDREWRLLSHSPARCQQPRRRFTRRPSNLAVIVGSSTGRPLGPVSRDAVGEGFPDANA